MGAGKSTIGRHLSTMLGMQFFDVDQTIEARTGADIGWIFDLEGEEGFRKREERVIDELVQKKDVIVATGGGAILSAASRKKLSSRGIVVYLTVTIEKQLQRTQRDKRRPLLQENNGLSPKEQLCQLAKEREPMYASIADLTLPTDTQTAKQVAQQIVHWMYEQ